MIKIFEKFNEPEVMVNYWDNGQKKYEEWLLNGKRHREDGPAYQYWYENGQRGYDGWLLNDKFHREDGPAYQNWDKSGQVKSKGWYLNDKKYSREDWVEKLGEIGSKHYEEQRMLLDMEKYNL